MEMREYIKKVWREKRYNEFINERKEQLDRLDKLLKEHKLI